MRMWKAVLSDDGAQVIRAPEDMVPLAVQEQNGELCIWYAIDPSKPMRVYDIRIVGTGHDFLMEVLADWKFVGTVQRLGGDIIWHVFIDLRSD